jgi:integrase
MEDHGYVFTGQTGAPLHVNSLDIHFRRLIAGAGVPTIRFHDLRHTCATLLLAEDVHPKIVQVRLGHADIGMTLNRYSQSCPTCRARQLTRSTLRSYAKSNRPDTSR